MFTHSCHNHLFSPYYVPGIVLGIGNTPMNKADKNPCPDGTYIIEEQVSNSWELSLQTLS